MTRLLPILFFCSVLLGVVVLGPDQMMGQDPVDFAHDIMPVLKERCGACHLDGIKQGGLSLENRASLVESGTVVAGEPDESDLIDRLMSDDPEYRMPPDGKRLTPEEVKAFRKWIDTDLEWPDSLAFSSSESFRRPLALRLFEVPDDGNQASGVDHWVKLYFEQKGITPPALLEDGKYLRRLKLDLLGQLPTPEEVRQFANDKATDKYERLVDRLLADNRAYADHWISFWNDLLRNDYAGTGYIDGGRKQITQWLHGSLMANKPYDQFVGELIHPSAESEGFIKGIKWRGRVNSSQIEPLQFSQNVSQVFLGINMKCASCHDSFIDDWRLVDAYGLAAITSEKPLQIFRCDVEIGQVAQPRFVFPELGGIDGTAPRMERLKQLAELVTHRDNGRFPRTIVNRLWQRMMGRGLIHPVDVMGNEAWSEPLLDFLAKDLVDHQYDLKRTMRLIANSRIYRSKSISVATSETGYRFQGPEPKRMTAEQFVDAVWHLTGAGPDKIVAQIEDGANNTPTVRASLVHSDALMRSLGRPNREQVVSTRPSDLTTLEALDLSNGERLDNWLQQGASTWHARLSADQWSADRLSTELFWSVLSREPTPAEKTLLQFSDEITRDTVQDLLWSLIMLPEFQYIH